MCIIVWLRPETKAPCGRAPPSPAALRGRMERNRQKPVGRDKGSLTDQQTKGTITTTTIQIRRIHKKADCKEPLSRPAAAAWSRTSTDFPPRSSPPPEHSMTAHGTEYPVLFGQVGSARLSVFPPGSWWKLTLSWPDPGQCVFSYPSLSEWSKEAIGLLW